MLFWINLDVKDQKIIPEYHRHISRGKEFWCTQVNGGEKPPLYLKDLTCPSTGDFSVLCQGRLYISFRKSKVFYRRGILNQKATPIMKYSIVLRTAFSSRKSCIKHTSATYVTLLGNGSSCRWPQNLMAHKLSLRKTNQANFLCH